MAASSETGIVNTGLILLGELPILSLTDDSDVARAANAIYSHVRDEVLAQHPWNGCTKQVTLARLSGTPIFGWSYQYVYPSDGLRILFTDDDQYPWKVSIGTDGQTKVVMSDAPTLAVEYIFRQTNVSRYGSWLAFAMSKRMAAELALTLTQHQGKARDLMDAYQAQLSMSKMMDGQEQSPDEIISTTLTDDVRL